MAQADRIAVRRVLTETPLARQHESMLSGRVTRRHPQIPWKAFDRTKHSAPALALALDAQRSLALGEYCAVDLFARISSALALNGAPWDVVAAATRVSTDEIRHADYAIRMAQLLAGREIAINVDRALIARQWGKGSLDLDALDGIMVEVSAIGETLACALLSACKERATDPTLHTLLASIVADEVHHARLGWYYLAWRAPQWSRAERQRVADRAGRLVMAVERRFSKGRDAPRGHAKAARALGVLETAGQRKAVRRVMEEEIVPGLDALGLGASHAWRVRQRVA